MSIQPVLHDAYSALPAELKQRPQWVCHKKKVPYNARTKKPASSTDPGTWSTFEDAHVAYLDSVNNFSGIGYVFSEHDPYIGVDLDKCRNATTGETLEWATSYIKQLSSYTELSPSGTGYHIFVRADLALDRHRANFVEIYNRDRYFTITGKHLEGTPLTIEERTNELQKMYDTVFHVKRERSTTPQSLIPATASDDEILSIIRHSKQREKFEALWRGDISDYEGDASRADLALCSLLAFYCGPDGQRQVDRLFRRSGLMRAKWHEPRGRQSYGQRTIENAYAHRGAFYQTHVQQDQAPAISESSTAVPDTSFVRMCLDKEEYGDSLLFARLFKGKLVYDYAEKAWYVYQGQYWKRDDTGLVKQLVAGRVANQYLITASEVLKGVIGAVQEDGEKARKIAEKCTRRAALLRKLQRTTNVISYAATSPDMGISCDQWDRNPWLLGTPNGVVDLVSGKLRDALPRDFIRTIVNAEWSGLATPCPRFERFLREIFDDQPEKEVLIGYLQRLLGYSITGLSDQAVFPVLYGEEGRNGKSTLIRHLGRVLGKIAGTINNDVLIDSKGRAVGSAQPYLVELQGKRLLWASETTEGARFNVAQVKYITGGDEINARGLYENNRTFVPTHTVLLLTNHRPHADATDKAFWERVRLISFNLRFVETPTQSNERQIDYKLDATLESEKSGILAWLVRGCLEYQKQGLNTPKSIREATEAYQKEEDSIEQFIEEECFEDATCKVEARRFYEAYSTWSKSLNISPMSGKAFGKRVERRFEKKRLTRGYMYMGVGVGDTSISNHTSS